MTKLAILKNPPELVFVKYRHSSPRYSTVFEIAKLILRQMSIFEKRPNVIAVKYSHFTVIYMVDYDHKNKFVTI